MQMMMIGIHLVQYVGEFQNLLLIMAQLNVMIDDVQFDQLRSELFHQ
jgi:hypothetical protein